jgi:hypothetical protein
MSDLPQIRIVQAGSEIFAFDTIRWPHDVFEYPIVYLAEAMNAGSYDANKIGWKWINRTQFEWLVKHYSCMVEYRGGWVQPGRTFYCNNHKCWETDQDILNPIESYKLDPDEWEERLV